MNNIVRHKREKIVVVGGGLSGCLSALFAARAGYDVTLLEAKSDILSGASEVAARLHLGAEYPLDPETGKDCLWGAALWKILFPQQGVFTDQSPMRFLVSTDTQHKGEQGLAGGFTLAQYLHYYQGEIGSEYQRLIDHISNFGTVDGNKVIHMAGRNIPVSDKTRIESGLFGPANKLCRRLNNNELHWYQGKIYGGFQSQEPGLDIVRYLPSIKQGLVNAGVHIICGNPVESVEKEKDHSYLLHCGGKTYSASQLIQAAWEGGFALDGGHRSPAQHKKVHIYRRALALVDTHNIPEKDLPPPSFTLKDEFGGMFSRLTKDLAIVYHPAVGHLEETELDSADVHKRTIPASWRQSLPQEEEQGKLRDYKHALIGGPYPFLKNAEFKALLVRPTLNFQSDITQRRHEDTEEIKKGYHIINATKLTLAPRAAIEAVEALRARTKAHEAKPEKNGNLFVQTGRAFALDCALSDPLYQLSDLKVKESNIAAFMQEHEWPINATTVIQNKDDHPRIRADYGLLLSTKEELCLVGPPTLINTNLPAAQNTLRKRFNPYHVSIETITPTATGGLFDACDPKNETLCNKIQAWATASHPKPFTKSIVPFAQLAPAFYNRLQHANFDDLLFIISTLDEESRQLLFSQKNFSHFPAQAWTVIRQSHVPTPLPNIAQIIPANDRITATMLPILFATLEPEQRIMVMSNILAKLHETGADKAFLSPLANPDIHRLSLEESSAITYQSDIINNGHAIQIDFKSENGVPPITAEFQGEKFSLVQCIIENTGDAKSVAKPRGQISSSTLSDEKPRGQLQFIFRHIDPGLRHKTELKVFSPIRLGKENRALGPYIYSLQTLGHPPKTGEGVSAEIVGHPLQFFNNQGITTNNLPEIAFHYPEKSAKRGTASESPYNALYIMQAAKDITLSAQQLDALEQLQLMQKAGVKASRA